MSYYGIYDDLSEHDEYCPCEECLELRDDARELNAQLIWDAENAAANRADNLMGGALSEDDDPIAPARGILSGVVIGAIMWGVMLWAQFGHAQEIDHSQLWTNNVKAAVISNAALRSFDTVQMCQLISDGGREVWLPVKSCGGIAAWNAGSLGVQIGVTAWLNHTNHHKLAQFAPWIFTGLDAAAIGYTFTHKGAK